MTATTESGANRAVTAAPGALPAVLPSGPPAASPAALPAARWTAPLTAAAALAAAAFLTAAGDVLPALDLSSMETPMIATTTLVLPRRSTTGWIARWRDRLAALLQRPARIDGLHGLDARMLADIGLDASEISSVDAEARSERPLTRRRIVRGSRHA